MPKPTPQGNMPNGQPNPDPAGDKWTDPTNANSAFQSGQLIREEIDGAQKGQTKGDGSEGSSSSHTPLQNLDGHNDLQPAPGSNHESPFKNLKINTSRTYDENRRDPIFQACVRMVTRVLQKAAADVRSYEKNPTGSRHTITPLDGNVPGRLDLHMVKQYAETRDPRFFRSDSAEIIPTEGDICMLVDGSGSMSGERLVMAAYLTLLFAEGAKLAKFRVFANLWGDSDPYRIVTPEMPVTEYSSNIDRILKGLQSGTQLCPGLRDMTSDIIAHRPPAHKMRGGCHWMLFSDCELNAADSPKSVQYIKKLLQHPSTTLDIIRTASHDTDLQAHLHEMRRGIRLKSKTPQFHDLENMSDAAEVALKVLVDRMHLCKGELRPLTLPDFVSQFKRVQNKGRDSV